MKKFLREKKEVFLCFNGRYLFSNEGTFVSDAVSGKPTAIKVRMKTNSQDYYITEEKELTFDYSKERQSIKNEGGLPEGIYRFRCLESGSLLNGNLNKHLFRRFSWGSYHWILIPLPQTNTYQRDRNSFTIHGGNNFGSAGCIDLQKNDAKLRAYLKGIHQTDMYLFVEYDEKKITVTEEKKISP